jgi:Pyridoxamine 5'-phosphate oxidase
VYETDVEFDDLQQLLDRSFAVSSEHLRSIMTPERRLDSRRLVTELDGVCVLSVATVTARGEPRLSAVDGHFLHGHWFFATDGGSPKVRQLAARPAVSAAYTPRDGLGVFCHGQAHRLERGSAQFDALDRHWTVMYGASFDTLGDDIACLRIDAQWLVGFAMTDAEMAEVEAGVAARAARRAAAAEGPNVG